MSKEDDAKKVSIVILNWNGRELLRGCLESMPRTGYQPHRVVVVDNGSTDGSEEMVRKSFPDTELLQTGRNLGYAGGNNVGIKYAIDKHHADYVVLLNNDTKVIDPSWLTWLVEAADVNDSTGIFGCLLIAPGGTIHQVGLEVVPGFYLPFPSHEMNKPALGCSLIKREVIDRIGLLDEGYSPTWFEDLDYVRRAKKAGFKVTLEPKSRILHYGSATIARRPSLESLYVYRRNAARYLHKYQRQALILFVLLSYAGCMAIPLRVRGTPRAHALRTALGNTTRAIIDGIASN